MVSSYTLCKNNDDTIAIILRYAVATFEDVVVVDSGSTDTTIDIIKDFAGKYPKINFIENKIEDKELVNQFNFALKQCKGDWLVRLDSDEIYSFSDWEVFLSGMDKFSWHLNMHALHLQKDINHYNAKLFKVYWKRAWRNNKNIFYRRDEKGEENYTIDLAINFKEIEDKFVIHFGHIREKGKQIQKFKDYEELKYPHDWKYDPRYDGTVECLHTRNAEWDTYAEQLPENIKKWIAKFI